MAKMPKGFISLGLEDAWLNTNVVDEQKSYLDKRTGMVAVIDIYGIRYNVSPALCEGKIRWRE